MSNATEMEEDASKVPAEIAQANNFYFFPPKMTLLFRFVVPGA